MSRPKPQGFLDAAFPPPGHSESSSFRLLASTSILIFLVALSYLGATSETGARALDNVREGTRLGSWVWSAGVAYSGPSVVPELGPQVWPQGVDPPLLTESIDEDDDVDDAADDAADDESEATSSGGPDLDRYVWHRDLPWKPSHRGRLIILGDIHGAIRPFRCAVLF
jgi:hypothetical protein